jgi:hypothetical protein
VEVAVVDLEGNAVRVLRTCVECPADVTHDADSALEHCLPRFGDVRDGVLDADPTRSVPRERQPGRWRDDLQDHAADAEKADVVFGQRQVYVDLCPE